MKIISGKTFPPQRRVLYGPSGVGKSTFACAESGALALDYERGLEHIGIDRVVGPDRWEASLALVREACAGPGAHKAVVIDTIDKLEEQLAEDICAKGIDGKFKKTLAEYGFQAGFRVLEARWREFLFELESAAKHGRSVTLVAHVKRDTVRDPMLGDYAKWGAALHKDCWTATFRWADAGLFATYETGLVDGRAVTTGARVLHTVSGTGFDAKHRPNIAPLLPLTWEAYVEAVAMGNRGPAEITASIRAMVTSETAERAEELIGKAGGDVSRLAQIEVALKRKAG